MLALIMLLSAFVGCGTTPPPPPAVDNTQDKDNTDNETSTEIPKPEFKVTDTFYPQYYDAEYEYQHMKKNVREWFYEKLESDTLFSVYVGEEDIEALKKRFVKDVKSETNADGHETVTATYVDDTTKMKFTLEAILYKDFPTVDYVMWAEYTGTEGYSAPLSQFNVLDSSYEIAPDKGYKLHTATGSYADIEDFMTLEQELPRNNTWYTYGPGFNYKTGVINPNGRSTDRGWPYFDIIGKDCGLMLAIGWTGQWEATFNNGKVGEISMKVYQRGLDTVLFPGEKVRSPRIVLSYFDGDAEYGHNVLRKLIVEHYTPENDDENRFVSPICVNFWGGRTASYVKKVTKLYADAGITYDATWFDAGWYADYPNNGEDATTAGSDWHTKLGWYTVNKKLFPTGNFKDVSDVFHEAGTKFLLWYMIEDGRDDVSDKLVFGRDAYYSAVTEGHRIVLRLCDDEVLEMVLDLFREKMDNEGVDWIRVDNWRSEWVYWVQNDKEDSAKIVEGDETLRQGMTENKHVLNYYKLWDTLYAEYPDFMLDNCASGGRRLDIEMASRGVPLWRTDYQTQDLEAMQAQTQWLSYWLPFSSTGVVSPSGVSRYQLRSLYSSSQCLSSNVNKTSMDSMAKLVDELKHVRPYWYGSYYQILEPNYGHDAWNAYELFREDWQKGIMVVARHSNAALETMKVNFKGLEPDRTYLVHDIDDSENENDFTMTGKELMEEGMTVNIPQRYIGVYEFSLVEE